MGLCYDACYVYWFSCSSISFFKEYEKIWKEAKVLLDTYVCMYVGTSTHWRPHRRQKAGGGGGVIETTKMKDIKKRNSSNVSLPITVNDLTYCLQSHTSWVGNPQTTIYSLMLHNIHTKSHWISQVSKCDWDCQSFERCGFFVAFLGFPLDFVLVLVALVVDVVVAVTLHLSLNEICKWKYKNHFISFVHYGKQSDIIGPQIKSCLRCCCWWLWWWWR